MSVIVTPLVTDEKKQHLNNLIRTDANIMEFNSIL